MGKFGWTVIFILCATLAADEYLYNGYFRDGAVSMLRQIEHGFGW